MLPDRKDIVRTVSFKTSRSGGRGGQNVNKVSSKVELIFNVNAADWLAEEEKALLRERLYNRLDQEGNLHVVSQEDRSQLMNKERSIDKFIALIRSSLHVDLIRKPTRTPRRVIVKRKSDKQSLSIKKENRKRPGFDA